MDNNSILNYPSYWTTFI